MLVRNSLNTKIIKTKTKEVSVSNASYISISGSELESMFNGNGISIVNINIPRNSTTFYHFVTGFGINPDGSLFVYFDGAITGSTTLHIYYIES